MSKSSTKIKVLELLEKNREESISGEAIAKELGISRNSVWKSITELRNNGYVIEAVTNKGYRISSTTDIISEQGIRPNLFGKAKDKKIIYFDEIDSTNTYAKQLAISDAEHGTVVVADCQTKGRGRFSRAFYSPSKNGIYMSIILKPKDLDLDNLTSITLLSANIICRVIEKYTTKKPMIKWVNDIYIENRKVCGILSEGSFDFESRTAGWIVVGMGLNVLKPKEGFPDEIKNIAGYISDDELSRNKLIADIMNEFVNNEINEKDILIEYKSRLFILGKKVTVNSRKESYSAVVKDINEMGHLIVEKENGEVVELLSEEISIKI